MDATLLQFGQTLKSSSCCGRKWLLFNGCRLKYQSALYCRGGQLYLIGVTFSGPSSLRMLQQPDYQCLGHFRKLLLMDKCWLLLRAGLSLSLSSTSFSSSMASCHLCCLLFLSPYPSLSLHHYHSGCWLVQSGYLCVLLWSVKAYIIDQCWFRPLWLMWEILYFCINVYWL